MKNNCNEKQMKQQKVSRTQKTHKKNTHTPGLVITTNKGETSQLETNHYISREYWNIAEN